MLLRSALESFVQGWKEDLSGWRSVLDGVEPDPTAVGENLTFDPAEPIFPGRRAKPLQGAPVGAHALRAFDELEPEHVRAVIVGQDPYPRISQATGRSFEQGDLTDWPEEPSVIADSLQRIVQLLLVARTGVARYGGRDANWAEVAKDLAEGAVELESPRELFDRLTREGVLFLNSGLTLTRFKPGGSPEQLRGHIPFWRPVVEGVLRFLATRDDGQVVFLLWGAKARNVYDRGRIHDAAQAAGTLGVRVATVEGPHPNAQPSGQPFFQAANPFLAANQKLIAMGGEPIQW